MEGHADDTRECPLLGVDREETFGPKASPMQSTKTPPIMRGGGTLGGVHLDAYEEAMG